jgi:hypothetical protein
MKHEIAAQEIVFVCEAIWLWYRMLIRMRSKQLASSVCLVLCFFAMSTHAVLAAEAPASKCVTATTVNTHTAVMARLEKDIAPYLKNEKAAGIIASYREAIDVSWEAMKEPYCGFGVYGIKSAVKSYSKSTDRARLAFMEAVKGLAKGIVPVTTPMVTVAPIPAPELNPKPVPVAAPAVSSAVVMKKTAGNIPRGLVRGMRGEMVSALQARLASHFKIADISSIQTGYFGPKTQEYLIKFQIEKGIVTSVATPGAGLVGPKTAAALNAE